MCGGAIISDFIPTVRSERRVTADYLWRGSKRGGANGVKTKKSNGHRRAVKDTEDDFEADFQEFEYESMVSEVEDEVEHVDKPFAFASTGNNTLVLGKESDLILLFLQIFVLYVGVKLIRSCFFSVYEYVTPHRSLLLYHQTTLGAISSN